MNKLFSKFSQLYKARTPQRGEFYIDELDMVVTLPEQSFFVEGVQNAKNLASMGFHFYNNNGTEIRFDFDGMTCAVTSSEELFILNEIYHQGTYNLQTALPMTVWDIGMNVGFASLFFAQMENVKHVYGYEPVEYTFKAAEKNINLSPELSKKITIQNYGIGANAGEQTLQYVNDYKGSIGKFGIAPQAKDKIAPDKIVDCKVKILQASSVLAEIVRKIPETQLLIKIDCEGAEYEIVEELVANADLDKVSAMVIEWHQLGDQKLIKPLSQKGFSCYSLFPHSSGTGMLYCFKNSL